MLEGTLSIHLLYLMFCVLEVRTGVDGKGREVRCEVWNIGLVFPKISRKRFFDCVACSAGVLKQSTSLMRLLYMPQKGVMH